MSATFDVVYSQFADDPDLGELIDLFVAEMPEKLSRMFRLYEACDWQELGRLAHQLKGSGGGYGFPQLTEPAARVESAAQLDDPAEPLLAELTQLLQVARRLRGGNPA